MRSADAITLVRTLMAVPAAYMVLAKFSPVWITVLIAAIMALDMFDGYAGLREASGGSLGFFEYISAVLGDRKAKDHVSKYKKFMVMSAAYGARIDIAGDRAVEYIFWIVYTVVGLVPLWVTFLIVLRHSFVDALMGAKGTSSEMKSRFARAVYASPAGRAVTPVLKFVTFSYLSFVYVLGYPLIYGQALVGLLVFFIMLRGYAEFLEFKAGTRG